MWGSGGDVFARAKVPIVVENNIENIDLLNPVTKDGALPTLPGGFALVFDTAS